MQELKRRFLMHYHATNAIHYQGLLDHEKANRNRPACIIFREQMLQYHEEQYCHHQGPMPLMNLGFYPAYTEFHFILPSSTN